jgi:hypothetical protein
MMTRGKEEGGRKGGRRDKVEEGRKREDGK